MWEWFPVHDLCMGNFRRINYLVNFAEVSDAQVVNWEPLQQGHLEIFSSTPPGRNVDLIEISDGN